MIPFPRLTVVLSTCALAWSLRGADPWQQMMGNGFGQSDNICVSELRNFRGLLYAGTVRRGGTGAGQIWRSSEGVNWTNVTPSLPASAEQVSAMNVTLFDPGYLYFGTRNTGAGGAGLYRSSDGVSWTHVNGPGSTGWTAAGNVQIGARMAVFSRDTNVYFGTLNASGAQLWKVPFNGNTFTKVLDFGANGSGVDFVTSVFEWNRTLYVGTRSPSGAQIWTSTNGTTWTKNAGVGNGFGSSRNTNIAAMAEFVGNLYVSTHNSTTGGQLWRTANGNTWTPINANGFGNPNNVELRFLSLAFASLWVTTTTLGENTAVAAQVWRSLDGTNFFQSNISGFGNNNNAGGFPAVESFGERMFWGGQNLVGGAQVWSTLVPPSIKVQPTGQTTTYGSDAIFFVSGTGSSPLSYQWLHNGSPIPGETGEVLFVNNCQDIDSGDYQVVVSNSAGSTTSRVAALILICPTITLSPTSLPGGNRNQFYSETITAAGGRAPYRFRASQLSVPPGTSMAINGVLSGTPTTAGTYTFVVFADDDFDCTGSRSYTVTITGQASGPPTITQDPASLVVDRGTIANFSVVASGDGPLNYQWRFNGANIGGAVGSSYTIGSAQPFQAGGYDVMVSNGAGSVTSQVATLTVICPNLSISPATLPDGVLNQAYNQQLTASGGAAPYTFTLISGSLPPNLNLSSAGLISGTATTAGSFTFVVRAMDSAGCQPNKSYTIKVFPPLEIESITVEGVDVRITWASAAGATYRLQFKNDLSDPVWQNLAPDVTATGPTASATDPLGAGPRFYQVQLLP